VDDARDMASIRDLVIWTAKVTKLDYPERKFYRRRHMSKENMQGQICRAHIDGRPVSAMCAGTLELPSDNLFERLLVILLPL